MIVSRSQLIHLLAKGASRMYNIRSIVVISVCAIGMAFAQAATAASDCATKAISKDGKPLAGAAKRSFMKKCEADACAARAIDKNGKPLAGAAKTSFMKKCEADANSGK